MRLILFVICCGFLSSCITMKPVEFKSAEKFVVSKVNNSYDINFSMLFFNPNSFGCTITSLEAIGIRDKQLFFNTDMKTKLRISRKSNFDIPVNATLTKMDLNNLLGTGISLFLNNENSVIEVKGKIRMRKFLFARTYKFYFTQTIDKDRLLKLF